MIISSEYVFGKSGLEKKEEKLVVYIYVICVCLLL